ncbi:hypothetical protein FGO68_gene4153 [Halteria grandinella]|uniref:Kelch motif family protein n=1 Tax=Halteria grandinella TaxID=5974 RepID=A0A8J8P160_HALGN|nr:hypothetical protein FGO68_gene4153 [Halteria grandinella]
MAIVRQGGQSARLSLDSPQDINTEKVRLAVLSIKDMVQSCNKLQSDLNAQQNQRDHHDLNLLTIATRQVRAFKREQELLKQDNLNLLSPLPSQQAMLNQNGVIYQHSSNISTPLQKRVFHVESSSEFNANSNQLHQAPRKLTRKRGTTTALVNSQVQGQKNFKEDSIAKKLFSPQAPLMKMEHLEDPGQYTESLFNFPADGTEEPTDPKASVGKELLIVKKLSKKQAKMSGVQVVQPVSLQDALNEKSQVSTTAAKRKKGRPKKEAKEQLKGMNNLHDMSTNSQNHVAPQTQIPEIKSILGKRTAGKKTLCLASKSDSESSKKRSLRSNTVIEKVEAIQVQSKSKKDGTKAEKKRDRKKQRNSAEESPPTKGKDFTYLLKNKYKQKKKKGKGGSGQGQKQENAPESSAIDEQQKVEESESEEENETDSRLDQCQKEDSILTNGKISGKGRSLASQFAKIVVKISLQRCILFNILEKQVYKAFSQIKAPEKIKSKASIVLTNNDQMFILGGEDKGVYQGRNYMYHYTTMEFAERAPMLEPRVLFGCIYFYGQIYVVGGWKEQYTQKAEVYNIDNDQWTHLPSLNDEREDVSLCIVKDRYLYAFGNVTSRGRRFKPSKNTANLRKQNIEYTFERIDLLNTKSLSNWEVITVQTTFSEIEKMPSMKHMGCFNHFTDTNKIILFGGGQGPSISNKSFCIDIEEGTLSKYSKLAKGDRFQNHIYFKKEEKLYVFGEFYLHTLNLTKEKWVQDPTPLNQSAVTTGQNAA